MPKPEVVLKLDSKRRIVNGGTELLNKKIDSGGDLRISTGFLHNEHIDKSSNDNQLIIETSTFAETVMIDTKWSAFFMTLRQPVALRDGFGYPNSLSLFLYNQNGQQALARMVLNEIVNPAIEKSISECDPKKNHTINVLDNDTLGASKNFIYDFEFYNFIITDCYVEVYANTQDGTCVFGDIELLKEAYNEGRGIKIAMKGLSNIMWEDTRHEDEIFIHCGSSYYYTKDKLMISNTLPFVSVPADIPLEYKSRGFRYCWVVARTDGRVEIRTYNPFDDIWETRSAHLSLRWFAQT